MGPQRAGSERTNLLRSRSGAWSNHCRNGRVSQLYRLSSPRHGDKCNPSIPLEKNCETDEAAVPFVFAAAPRSLGPEHPAEKPLPAESQHQPNNSPPPSCLRSPTMNNHSNAAAFDLCCLCQCQGCSMLNALRSSNQYVSVTVHPMIILQIHTKRIYHLPGIKLKVLLSSSLSRTIHTELPSLTASAGSGRP